MPKVPDGFVLSHWCKPFDFFQASTKEVYSAVEAGVARRQVPDTKVSRVIYSEGGVLSAGREYLRFERKGQQIDLCAAPFGTSYFFSWWLVEPQPSWGIVSLFLLFLAALALVSTFFKMFGFILGGLATLVALPVIGWALGNAVRQGKIGVEQDVIAIPIIGRLYVWLFKPVTYYRIDTAQMFQAAVHSALLEVIDGLTTAKGIRALSEAERKPIMQQFGEIPIDAGIAHDDRGGAPAHTA